MEKEKEKEEKKQSREAIAKGKKAAQWAEHARSDLLHRKALRVAFMHA